MAAILEPPPGQTAGARATADVPWSPAYADETAAGITRSVAITFALFGLLSTFLLGALVGATFRLIAPPGVRSVAAGGTAGGAAVTLDVTAAEFTLAPAELHLPGPGRVTVTLKNAGLLEHDFTIEGVPGKVDAKPGGAASGVFQITKAGTYIVYCSVPGHKEAGMQGTLTVR